MTTDLPPYTSDHPTCPKCRHTSATTHYVDGIRSTSGIPEHHGERLLRVCSRCSYQWNEAVAGSSVTVLPDEAFDDEPYEENAALRDAAAWRREGRRQAANETHWYTSTGCLHGRHDYCASSTGRSDSGQTWDKAPGKCKWCPATCLCECHVRDKAAADG